jgi:uncharacterized protein
VNSLSSFNPLYSLSGFAVGFLVGLTGVGGGSLMTPLLVLLFGIHPATAVGTDLLYASITKCAGVAIHGWSRTVDWRVTGRLASGSLPATAATLLTLSQLGPASERTAAFISAALGMTLILSAISLMCRDRILGLASKYGGPANPRRTAILTVLTGVVLGVMISLSSVGAGAIGVTVLILLYPRLPMARIVGSDLAHAVPLTLVAGIDYWLLGSVDGLLLGSLLLGSLPGIVIGSLVSARVPERLLRPILAATLAAVGSKLLW